MAAGHELLYNLAQRHFGYAAVAAAAIQEQLQASLDLLSDAGIRAVFQAHGPWDLLQKIVGPDGPDVGRAVHRGQCGYALLHWIAGHVAQLGAARLPELAPQDQVVLAAAQWLQASGIGYIAGEAAA